MEGALDRITVELSSEDVELVRAALTLMMHAEDDPDVIARLKELLALFAAREA